MSLHVNGIIKSIVIVFNTRVYEQPLHLCYVLNVQMNPLEEIKLCFNIIEYYFKVHIDLV